METRQYEAKCAMCTFVGKMGTQQGADAALAAHMQRSHPAQPATQGATPKPTGK